MRLPCPSSTSATKSAWGPSKDRSLPRRWRTAIAEHQSIGPVPRAILSSSRKRPLAIARPPLSHRPDFVIWLAPAVSPHHDGLYLPPASSATGGVHQTLAFSAGMGARVGRGNRVSSGSVQSLPNFWQRPSNTSLSVSQHSQHGHLVGRGSPPRPAMLPLARAPAAPSLQTPIGPDLTRVRASISQREHRA
jgi:hypothetical protein